MELLFLLFIFLLGLVIGSFLNCLVWRLYSSEGMTKRSYCPKCKHQIAWYDNIPVVSFILLTGKCRHCQEKISWQYPFVELVVGVLFVGAFISSFQLPLQFGAQAIFTTNFQFPISNLLLSGACEWLSFLRYLIIIAVMIMILIFDARWYLIPDKITVPAIALVFPLNIFLGFEWQDLLISGIIGGSFFGIQYAVSRGKWIGGGDIRMGALMGVALGPTGLAVALFLAYIIGSLVGIGLMLVGRKKWGSRVPFGIFLSTGSVIALFWGAQIAAWYLNLLYL